jgi:hypothetical protein
MGRNFPSRRINHRFHVWRDRRRYPWRYPEAETRRFGRRAPRSLRRRFFVIRSLEDAGGIDHCIFAECPNYAVAMEVAALHGDRVFTEGQMLDHPERLRTLTAWDKGDRPQRGRQPNATARPRQTSSETLSTIEAPHG